MMEMQGVVRWASPVLLSHGPGHQRCYHGHALIVMRKRHDHMHFNGAFHTDSKKESYGILKNINRIEDIDHHNVEQEALDNWMLITKALLIM